MVSIYHERGFITWRRLCRVVLTEPEKVLQQAEVALRLASPTVRPRILATVATAFRRTARLDGADKLYTKARHEAERVGDIWAVADIMHRWARVSIDRGEPKIALDRVREAISHYEKVRDSVGVGRALIAEGQYLAHLENFALAKMAFKSALKRLPTVEVSYRIAAMMNLAKAASEQKEHTAALDWARAASRSYGGIPLGILTDCIQVQGALAFELGDRAEAEACFRKCEGDYKKQGRFLDCAHTTVCLCEVLIEQGLGEEVVDIAKTTTELIGHLRRHRGPAGIIAALASHAYAGRKITLDLFRGYKGPRPISSFRYPKSNCWSLPVSIPRRAECVNDSETPFSKN